MAVKQKNGSAKADAEAKPRPVHEIRLGRIKCALWANETENGLRYNCTVSRIYKDQNGAWQRSTSFGLQDLPLVSRVSDLALLWIYEKTQEKIENNGVSNEEIPPDTGGEVPF